MFLLPKGKPLAENVPIANLQLPEALDKLKNGKLTGCAVFNLQAADCVLIYEDGRLISAQLLRNKTELKDTDALHALINLMAIDDNGSFNAYSLSHNANQAVLALVRGNKIITNQELNQVDFKALLERIKSEHMTATLKIFTDQRVGLILYRDGATVGFFHDTSQTIETTSGPLQQIAALPGARIDLSALTGTEGLTQDLAELIDIQSQWKTARSDDFTPFKPTHTPQSQPAPAVQSPTAVANCAEIEASIIEIANSFLGKLGKTLIEKELITVGGIKTLAVETKLSEFLNAVGKSSKLLASANKIKDMCNAMSTEVAKL